MAVDPRRRAPPRGCSTPRRCRRARGCIALDVVTGAGDYALPPLPRLEANRARVRIWGHSATASSAARMSSVARARRRAARDAVGGRRAGTRRVDQDPHRRRERRRSTIATASTAASCGRAGSSRARGSSSVIVHRGRLRQARRRPRAPISSSSSRSTRPPRATYWRRGDQAVLATLGTRPRRRVDGARGPSKVPELGRTLRMRSTTPTSTACSSRLRRAAAGSRPVMLEHLAKELRADRCVSSWALIAGRTTRPRCGRSRRPRSRRCVT